MRNLGLVVACVISTSAFAADMSSWSNATICRLIASQNDNASFVEEGKSRGLACALQPEGKGVKAAVITAQAGIDIENDATVDFIKPPISPSPTDSLYWFGRLWKIADFNQDGYTDVLYIGAMNPDNMDITGEDTSGLCGGGDCNGSKPLPSLFIGDANGRLIYTPELIINNRKDAGMSLGRQLLLADYNQDGVLDFYVADNAIGTHNGAVDSYYLSQPNGTWLESSETHLSHKQFKAFNHGAATGDIDNDGDMDVVYTELAVSKKGTAFWCLVNNGKGHMQKRRCGGSFAFGLELADMDGDGDLDALVGAHETDGSKWGFTGIVWNNGRGQFNNKKSLPKHTNKWSTIPEVSAADLDNDGDMDIVYSRAGVLYVGTAIQVLENLGNKKFIDHGIWPLVEAPESYKPVHEGNEWNDFIENIMFRDFNGDGLIDLYMASGSHKTNGAILINKGGFDLEIVNPRKALAYIGNDGVMEVSASQAYKQQISKPIKTIHSLNFGQALKSIESVKFEDKEQFTAFTSPVPLSNSGAVILGAYGVITSDKTQNAKARLRLQYGAYEISVGVCFEYYKQYSFMAARASFDSRDWGGLKDIRRFGTNGCSGFRGYVGHWEAGNFEQELKDLGLFAVLKDLDATSYDLLTKLNEISDVDLSALIATK